MRPKAVGTSIEVWKFDDPRPQNSKMRTAYQTKFEDMARMRATRRRSRIQNHTFYKNEKGKPQKSLKILRNLEDPRTDP